MKDLLVCIAFHYVPERLQYLFRIVDAFLNEYKVDVDIIIDTNVNANFYHVNNKRVQVIPHLNLHHPYNLAWCHREHMYAMQDDYKNFMYIEDDMYLPYLNYLNYLENFSILWPHAIPSFIRIEKNKGELFVTDVTEPQKASYMVRDGKTFVSLEQPYHAFWIMPQEAFKKTVNSHRFTLIGGSREDAASYPVHELSLKPFVQMQEPSIIDSKCYSYHLPNNYALDPATPFGKLKPENILI